LEKGSQKHFHVKEKQEFWEKGRETKNKGEEPRGESDSVELLKHLNSGKGETISQ